EPGYFRTTGIALVQGSPFNDTTESSREVIVNAAFARKHWPATSAIGHHIRIAQQKPKPWMTIVGVAADASTGGPISENTIPALFTPWSGGPSPTILIRTDAGAMALAPLVDLARAQGIKRSVLLENVEDVVSRSIAAPRFVMLLLSIFS